MKEFPTDSQSCTSENIYKVALLICVSFSLNNSSFSANQPCPDSPVELLGHFSTPPVITSSTASALSTLYQNRKQTALPLVKELVDTKQENHFIFEQVCFQHTSYTMTSAKVWAGGQTCKGVKCRLTLFACLQDFAVFKCSN